MSLKIKRRMSWLTIVDYINTGLAGAIAIAFVMIVISGSIKDGFNLNMFQATVTLVVMGFISGVAGGLIMRQIMRGDKHERS